MKLCSLFNELNASQLIHTPYLCNRCDRAAQNKVMRMGSIKKCF